MFLIDEEDFINRQVAKEEAINRMKKLKIDNKVINVYKSFDQIFCSCKGNLHPVTDNETEMIKEFEDKYGNYVYHIIHSFSDIGETYELLYVSCYQEDWKWENANIDSGYLLVYAENKTIPEYSESGSIVVINVEGSLLRVG